MAKLGSIGQVAAKLKTASKSAIKALHVIVFQEEGHRTNRSRLREFDGYGFDEDSEDFGRKTSYVDENSTNSDLSEGTKAELGNRIVQHLCDLSGLNEQDVEL